jgi:integrase
MVSLRVIETLITGHVPEGAGSEKLALLARVGPQAHQGRRAARRKAPRRLRCESRQDLIVDAFQSATPKISAAIETYFALYEQRSPGYRVSLRRIFKEFVAAASDKPIDTVTDLDFKTYEKRLASRGLANATQRTYIAQAGMLFHFAHKKGWLKRDPRVAYRPPKEELHDPNPMDDDALKAFFGFVRTPVRYRPEAWGYAEWIGIGFLTLGLRPIELMHARWEDVDWDQRFVFIRKSHPNKEPQALQNQPIPMAAWPQFLARRKAEELRLAPTTLRKVPAAQLAPNSPPGFASTVIGTASTRSATSKRCVPG